MKEDAIPDTMIVVGLALLAGGLAAYDWRLAMVVCGLVLLAMGIAAALRR